jgi:hypothetical protein
VGGGGGGGVGGGGEVDDGGGGMPPLPLPPPLLPPPALPLLLLLLPLLTLPFRLPSNFLEARAGGLDRRMHATARSSQAPVAGTRKLHRCCGTAGMLMGAGLDCAYHIYKNTTRQPTGVLCGLC